MPQWTQKNIFPSLPHPLKLLNEKRSAHLNSYHSFCTCWSQLLWMPCQRVRKVDCYKWKSKAVWLSHTILWRLIDKRPTVLYSIVATLLKFSEEFPRYEKNKYELLYRLGCRFWCYTFFTLRKCQTKRPFLTYGHVDHTLHLTPTLILVQGMTRIVFVLQRTRRGWYAAAYQLLQKKGSRCIVDVCQLFLCMHFTSLVHASLCCYIIMDKFAIKKV